MMAKEEKATHVARSGNPSNGIEGDISLLKQLIDSMDESIEKLQEFYKNDDAENLNKTKKFILNLKSEISEVLE